MPKTRRSILGSDGMTKSDCSLSALWGLYECSLSHPEVIMMISAQNDENWEVKTTFRRRDRRTDGQRLPLLELLSEPKRIGICLSYISFKRVLSSAGCWQRNIPNSWKKNQSYLLIWTAMLSWLSYLEQKLQFWKSFENNCSGIECCR